MTVPIAESAGSLQPGKPATLFEIAIARSSNASWMDATADGSRFVAIKSDDNARADGITHATFVLNFFDEIRRATAGK
jgi:hypothetical protein